MRLRHLLLVTVCLFMSFSFGWATPYENATTISTCDGIPTWDNTATYATNGTQVVYNGVLYRNKWWTKGDTPGSQWGPWEELGVCDANQAPSISITSPSNNASFILEETSSIQINTTSSDNDGTIASVSISVDGNSFNNETAAWTPSSAGTFTITATATDDQGSTSSTSVDVIITSNQPVAPTVSINSPSDQEVIQQTILSSISISISASDVDGTITSQSIEVDGQTFTTSNAEWTPSAFGSYTINASVTDNDGLTATSSVVVTVEEKVDSGCSANEYASYPTVYSIGDVVVYNGDLYEALYDNLYNVTPGEADHFWKPLGPCVDTNEAPVISVSNQSSIGLIPVQLTASIIDNENDPISATFEIDGKTLAAVQNNANFTAEWTPATYGSYNVTVNANDGKKSSSNSFTLTVEEPTGPQNPVITSFSPADGSIIKQTSLSPVNIEVNASDIDGSITGYLIEVDGQTFTTSTASWTPSGFGNYSISITVTDNENLTTSVSSSITIQENLAFTDKVLVGYWHNWDLASVPYIRLKDVDDRYNVICIAFAEPKIRDIDNTMIFDPIDINNFQNEPSDVSRAEFKQDVQYLQSLGKKILLSLGGANGVVHLDNEEEQQKFVTSMIGLCETYGFDGVDIDLEGSSLTLDAGDNDFRNPTTPRVLNFIEGMQAIKAHFGPSFLLTSAPETAYVQGGQTAYGGSWGGYLPILHTLRDQLDYVHVQLYNTGSLGALDGKAYTQGSADFIVAMTEMLLQGFETKSVAGFFPAFREDQVAIGLPANKPAAPAGGYTAPAEVQKALNYLVNGVSFGGDYTLVKSEGYPELRGMMTWSINWDKTTAYEYAASYDSFFGASNSRKLVKKGLASQLTSNIGNAYPNPFHHDLKFDVTLQENDFIDFYVYDVQGNILEHKVNEYTNSGNYTLSIDTQNLTSGLFLIKVNTKDQEKIFRVIRK
ncbi:glycosyl hydrolase family 18 protein [Flammeovirga sp. SubArs3]|uniref:Ig-like domain-containing protein n=1 Tax=Flammeovirga sp. SubArs3 TaxID=2995316 RepID=UPI00248B9D23|nr:glycosyl hydrolase family 18 protein [Flammeovirga sp. SubArs3]